MTGPAEETPTSDPERLRAEIEQTRAELARTVDQLGERLDVKAQVGKKADAAQQSVADAASHARHSAPQPVQHTLDSVSQAAGPVVTRIDDASRGRRGVIVAVAAGSVVLVLVVRRIRARRQR